VFGGKPEEVKTQEGIEVLAGLNRLSVAADRWSDQNPEGEFQDLVLSGKLGSRRTEQTARGDESAMSRIGWPSGVNP
jgi:hypothetical protein